MNPEWLNSLSEKAASVLNEAIADGRKHRYTNITPLHVVDAILDSCPDLSCHACRFSMQSQRPLHCKALMFLIANNLPAPLTRIPAGVEPVLAKGVDKAVDRAIRRRQPLNAEVEHLLISLLDEPSVGNLVTKKGLQTFPVIKNLEEGKTLFVCGDEPGPSTVLRL